MRPHPLVCAPDALIRKLGAQPRFLTQVAGIQLPLWVGVKKQLESGVKQDLNLGTATWEEAIPSSVLIARSNKLSDKTSPTFLETKLLQCFFKSSFMCQGRSLSFVPAGLYCVHYKSVLELVVVALPICVLWCCMMKLQRQEVECLLPNCPGSRWNWVEISEVAPDRCHRTNGVKE